MRTMNRWLVTGLAVVVMVSIIVSVDVLALSHHFWERLAFNVGIVLVAGSLAMRFRGVLGRR